MKKILFIIGCAASMLFIVILSKAILFQSKQLQKVPEVQGATTLEADAINRLTQLLKFKTISSDDSYFPKEEFFALHNYLEESYPLVYENLEVEIINDYSLFFTWEGSNPTLQPILFSGHIDVVPANASEWTVAPFEGYTDDEYVWGRGALDNKSIVFSTLEAAEELLREGFQPEKTICFVFTHDEELGGVEGTAAVAELFASRGMHFEYILDEGGMITDGIISGISSPIAMIGTAEKGAAIVELHVTQEGGTSAVPPEQTSIEILSETVNKLKKNQLPTKIDGATEQMLQYIGPEMSYPNKLFLSNMWLFHGIVENQLSKSSTMAAFLKTTTATTIMNGGVKFNVIPTEATAVVNYRIIQGDSVEGVLTHVKKTINDNRVSIRLIGYSVEPSPISDPQSEGYQCINKIVKQLFPDTIVTPYLWTGGTNSKHFVKYADNIYRFSPVLIDETNRNSIHGADEKISIENLNKCKQFYKQLMQDCTAALPHS